jgi:hypothetical protein
MVAVPSHVEAGLFVAALGVFHWLEYAQTSLWNPQHLSLDCTPAFASSSVRAFGSPLAWRCSLSAQSQ